MSSRIFISSVQKEFKAERTALARYIADDPLTDGFVTIIQRPVRIKSEPATPHVTPHVTPQVGTKLGPSRDQGIALESGPESDDPVTQSVTQSVTQLDGMKIRLLKALESGEIPPKELRLTLGVSHRTFFRNHHLNPALEEGLIEPTIPEKPTSRLQKYRLTEKGRALLSKSKPS